MERKQEKDNVAEVLVCYFHNQKKWTYLFTASFCFFVLAEWKI